MIICFELGMPNVGSWNGKWSGDGGKYYLHRNVPKAKAMEILENKERNSWYYNFGDGWGASVTATHVTSSEKRRLEKLSVGFAGYDWMVDEIIQEGKILTKEERKLKRTKEAAL